MKKLLISLCLISGGLFAQQNSICQFPFNFTNNTGFGTQPLAAPFAMDNRLKGCNFFTVSYQVTGLSALTLTLQSAGGPGTAGTWGTYSGTVLTGVNPLVSVAAAGTQSTFQGYVGWLRVNLTGTPSAATWQVTGIVYGSQTGASSGTGQTTCPAASPCEVDVKQVGGTATDTNAGNASAGTQRVVLASDQAVVSTKPSSASTAGADAISNTQFLPTDGTNVLGYRIFPMGFDGTTNSRLRVASLANMPPAAGGASTVSAGALLSENGGRVASASSPATGNQATATVAANATARHVVDKVCWSAVSTAASAATNIQVSLRDGATGAGTQFGVFSVSAVVGAAAGVQVIPAFCTPSLNIVGTTNTAMTMEFNAGVANVNETIWFTYYNVQ